VRTLAAPLVVEPVGGVSVSGIGRRRFSVVLAAGTEVAQVDYENVRNCGLRVRLRVRMGESWRTVRAYAPPRLVGKGHP